MPCLHQRVVDGRCLDCWRHEQDWRQGRLQPVTDRIERQAGPVDRTKAEEA